MLYLFALELVLFKTPSEDSLITSFRYSVFMDIGLKVPANFDIPSDIEAYFLSRKFTIVNYMEIYSVMSFVPKMEELDFKIEEVKRQTNEFTAGEQRLSLPMLEEGPAGLDVEPADAENTIPAAGADIVEEIKPFGTGKTEEFTGGEQGLYPPILEEGPAVLQVEPVVAENTIPAAVVDVAAEIKPSGTDNIVPKDTTMSDEKERKKARKAEKRARKRAKKAKKEAAKLAKESEFPLQSFYS